jgi:hypothetical protein
MWRYASPALLAGLILLAPLLYLPSLTHNLPVAANVDERTALEVLQRLQYSGLNPHFFMYPTLYFYLVHLLLKPFHFSNSQAMILGRLFNLTLLGLTAFITYIFCRDRLHSRAAGLVAAAFVLGSTVLSGVAGYLHPDLLMTASGMAALYYLTQYFEDRSPRAWTLGMVLVGVSTGCKYTAFILFIAYALAETVHTLRFHRDRPSADSRIPRSACIAALSLLGAALLLAAAFFPLHPLLDFVAHSRNNVDLRPPAYYLEFFRHIRHSLTEAGLLSLGFALLCRVSSSVYRCLALRRLYYGLGIVLLMGVLCTPFSVLQPKAFFFDLGALARSNLVVSGGHSQWTTYPVWIVQEEGIFLLALSAIGITILAGRIFAPARLVPKPQPQLTIVALYVALYLAVICSAPLGFDRYLAPVLPLLACAAGLAAAALWRSNPYQNLRRYRLLIFLPLAAAGAQITLHLLQTRRNSAQTNVYYASFQAARKTATHTAFYAGYAPSVELEEAGIPTRQLSWNSLTRQPLGQTLACGDVLILQTDDARQNHIDATHDSSVTLLLDDPRSVGQQVLRRSDCH